MLALPYEHKPGESDLNRQLDVQAVLQGEPPHKCLHPHEIHHCVILSSPLHNHKVNRCLARYSPRATNTNQSTNRAPNEPAQNEQKCQFWAKNPNFSWRNQKFCYPHNGKPPRHLVRIVFWSGIEKKGKKCQYLTKNANI